MARKSLVRDLRKPKSKPSVKLTDNALDKILKEKFGLEAYEIRDILDEVVDHPKLNKMRDSKDIIPIDKPKESNGSETREFRGMIPEDELHPKQKPELLKNEPDIENDHYSGKPPSGSLANLDLQELKEKDWASTFYESENIEMKTRLRRESITKIAAAKMIAESNGIQALADFCDNLMRLSVSIEGEGRKEGVEMTRAVNNYGFPNPGGN